MNFAVQDRFARTFSSDSVDTYWLNKMQKAEEIHIIKTREQDMAGDVYKLALKTAVEERRRARRFKVEWDVIVSGDDDAGQRFNETGDLMNLSSRGAFMYLTRRLKKGTKVDVWIKVPFEKERWMTYSAEVIRNDEPSSRAGTAIKFTTVRPKFINKASFLPKDEVN